MFKIWHLRFKFWHFGRTLVNEAVILLITLLYYVWQTALPEGHTFFMKEIHHIQLFECISDVRVQRAVPVLFAVNLFSTMVLQCFLSFLGGFGVVDGKSRWQWGKGRVPACCFCLRHPPWLEQCWFPLATRSGRQKYRGELRAFPLIVLPVSFYEDTRRCCHALEREYDEEIEQ